MEEQEAKWRKGRGDREENRRKGESPQKRPIIKNV